MGYIEKETLVKDIKYFLSGRTSWTPKWDIVDYCWPRQQERDKLFGTRSMPDSAGRCCRDLAQRNILEVRQLDKNGKDDTDLPKFAWYRMAQKSTLPTQSKMF